MDKNKIIEDIGRIETELEVKYGEILMNENSPFSLSECLNNPDMELVQKYEITSSRCVFYYLHIPTHIIHRCND